MISITHYMSDKFIFGFAKLNYPLLTSKQNQYSVFLYFEDELLTSAALAFPIMNPFMLSTVCAWPVRHSLFRTISIG